MYGYKFLCIRDIQEYSHYLNGADIKKVGRFVRADDRMRAIGSIILQKDYIRIHYPTLDYKDIALQYSDFGKPFYRDLVYNISHDSDLVIIAYSGSGSIGVDIMKRRDIDITPYLDCFSSREQTILTGSNFITFWCAKEAFGKTLGVGLSINMASIEFIEGAIHYGGMVYPVDFIDIPGYCCVVCPFKKKSSSWE